MYLGKVIHATIEYAMRNKIQTKRDFTIQKLLEVYDNDFTEMRKNEDEIDFSQEKPDELKDAGVKLIGLFLQEVSPKLKPVFVEEKSRLILMVKFLFYL